MEWRARYGGYRQQLTRSLSTVFRSFCDEFHVRGVNTTHEVDAGLNSVGLSVLLIIMTWYIGLSFQDRIAVARKSCTGETDG